MRPSAPRRSAAWAALLAVLAVLPFAALPASAAAGVVGVADASAAVETMECDVSCPMMEAARHSGESMPMACHRSGSRHGEDTAPGPSRMGCCDAPTDAPAVPLDEAVPSSVQVLDVPPPAPLPALPAPPVRGAAVEASGPPLPPGPPLYTLHSSLLN